MDKAPPAEDRRKFEAQLPNDIWQSDVMHGPKVAVDQKQRKTYLIAFIDDHSRLIVHAAFYLSENLAAFMDAFEKALTKRGMPRKLYHRRDWFRQIHGDPLSAQLFASIRIQNHLCDRQHIYVTANTGSIMELYRLIMAAFDMPPTGMSRALMSGRIKNQVLELLNGKKKNTVLVIDEASLLRVEVFAELHTLCQFEMDCKPYLPLILARQSNLQDNLIYPGKRPFCPYWKN